MMDKENVLCMNTMGYYSAIERKKILLFATIWLDHKGIMLPEISHTEKNKYHMISQICGI